MRGMRFRCAAMTKFERDGSKTQGWDEVVTVLRDLKGSKGQGRAAENVVVAQNVRLSWNKEFKAKPLLLLALYLIDCFGPVILRLDTATCQFAITTAFVKDVIHNS